VGRGARTARRRSVTVSFIPLGLAMAVFVGSFCFKSR
jgi:hypothetical protein